MHDEHEGCEACWGYTEMTGGRQTRCPWCLGAPPRILAGLNVQSLNAKAAHAKQRARMVHEKAA